VTKDRASEDIGRADQVGDLLTHIGWQEVIRPELARHRKVYEQLLVESVLGNKTHAPDGTALTSEQLAGRIYGLTEVEKLFEKILKNGVRALQWVNSVED
jgi:hypothetical protein